MESKTPRHIGNTNTRAVWIHGTQEAWIHWKEEAWEFEETGSHHIYIYVQYIYIYNPSIRLLYPSGYYIIFIWMCIIIDIFKGCPTNKYYA